MNVQSGDMKYALALKSIAARYCGQAMLRGYQIDWATAFLIVDDPASDEGSARLAGVHVNSEEL
jgi:hypothetical protein